MEVWAADATGAVPAVGLALGLLAGFGIWVWKRVNRRAEELKALAALYRWTYTPEADSLARRWRGQPFGTGIDRRVTDVLTGSHRGRHFAAFTYTFIPSLNDDASRGEVVETSPRGRVRPQVMTVFVLTLEDHLPAVEFTPAGLPLPQARLGGKQVDLAASVFSEAWSVTAGDPELAYSILHEGFVWWLLREDRVRTPMRFEGSDILTWIPGRVPLRLMVPELDALIEACDLMPGEVLDAYNRPDVVVGPGRVGPSTPVILPTGVPHRAVALPPVPAVLAPAWSVAYEVSDFSPEVAVAGGGSRRLRAPRSGPLRRVAEAAFHPTPSRGVPSGRLAGGAQAEVTGYTVALIPSGATGPSGIAGLSGVAGSPGVVAPRADRRVAPAAAPLPVSAHGETLPRWGEWPPPPAAPAVEPPSSPHPFRRVLAAVDVSPPFPRGRHGGVADLPMPIEAAPSSLGVVDGGGAGLSVPIEAAPSSLGVVDGGGAGLPAPPPTSAPPPITVPPRGTVTRPAVPAPPTTAIEVIAPPELPTGPITIPPGLLAPISATPEEGAPTRRPYVRALFRSPGESSAPPPPPLLPLAPGPVQIPPPPRPSVARGPEPPGWRPPRRPVWTTPPPQHER